MTELTVQALPEHGILHHTAKRIDTFVATAETHAAEAALVGYVDVMNGLGRGECFTPQAKLAEAGHAAGRQYGHPTVVTGLPGRRVGPQFTGLDLDDTFARADLTANQRMGQHAANHAGTDDDYVAGGIRVHALLPAEGHFSRA